MSAEATARAATRTRCRRENGPICEPPTETNLTAKACHTVIPKSAMNWTYKNRVLYQDTTRRIKSWNSGSVLTVVLHILKNPVNSYDSNGVNAVPISILGDEKRNLPFFLFTCYFLGIP